MFILIIIKNAPKTKVISKEASRKTKIKNVEFKAF